MNVILLAIIVYAAAKFAGLPDSVATIIAILAGGVEAFTTGMKWGAEYNAAKLKRVIHE